MYAIYARQSVEKKDSISIEMQIELCKSRVPPSENVEIYEDKGYSGTNTKRPGFQKMLTSARQGKINYIIVYKLDRISRSLADFARLWEELEEKNIKLFSYSEGLDTKTIMGQMLVKLLIMFAEMEQKTISSRIRDNYHARAEKMLPLGGIPPFGYNKDWTKNIDESIIIKECYQCVIAGKSLDETGRKMNFTGTKASRIIRNPVYVMCSIEVLSSLTSAGYKQLGKNEDFRYGYGIHAIKSQGEKYIAPGRHKGIIEPEIWLAAQELLNSRKPSSNGGSGKTSWLQGIIICGKCGSSCYIRDNGKGRPYLYITCQGKRKGICNGFSGMRLESVENFIEKYIVHELETILENEQLLFCENDDIIRKTKDEILRNLDDPCENDAQKIFSLERKMELLMRKKARSTDFQQCSKTLWKRLLFSEKKAVAKLLIKNIIVTEKKITIVFR